MYVYCMPSFIFLRWNLCTFSVVPTITENFVNVVNKVAIWLFLLGMSYVDSGDSSLQEMGRRSAGKVSYDSPAIAGEMVTAVHETGSILVHATLMI